VENIYLEEDTRVSIAWFGAHRWSDFNLLETRGNQTQDSCLLREERTYGIVKACKECIHLFQ
jgi:hypothetical protein